MYHQLIGLHSWFYTSKDDNNEPTGAPSMNGAMEVRQPNPPPLDVTNLAFGSRDKETLSGYCPVSHSIEPCTWKVLPVRYPKPAKIRIVF
ncbi:hypothetical protein Pfo_010751 [Paulownia fortunei]|nr:hypothetical protein Pfo_010751 [Paulownia fortunei]